MVATAKRLALFVAVATLTACSTGPTEVPLALLAAEQEEYDGRVVSTQGIVVPIEDPQGGGTYFVLEDTASNRVRLRPDTTARQHLDNAVTVTGEFRFADDVGRELHIQTIVPSG